ncbi:MAG: hypothetical protein EOO20_11760 [Chryseobacterium sp.]|nr:MAG: hypothetical protein EOO20_11760 [Chryseobacterium sp.]
MYKKLHLLLILGLIPIINYAQDLRIMLPIGHTGNVLSAEISTDGTKIITASDDKTVKIWDLGTGKLLGSLDSQIDALSTMNISKDGKKLLTISDDYTTKIWDLQLLKLLFTLKGHRANVIGANFSPNDGQVITYSNDRTARIWDVKTGKILK